MITDIGFLTSCYLWAFVLAELESIYDAGRIARDYPISHGGSAVIRVVLLGLMLGLLGWLGRIGWWSTGAGIGCSLAFFWLIFDWRLNERRGLDRNYLGKGAWLDRMLSYLPTWGGLVLKVLLIAVCSVLVFAWSEASN